MTKKKPTSGSSILDYLIGIAGLIIFLIFLFGWALPVFIETISNLGNT